MEHPPAELPRRHPRRRALLAATGALLAGTGCVGREPLPSFTYTLLDGSRHRSQALRGQVVLVNFWATHCASCVQEMPSLVALHQAFSARGLQTLAVAMAYDPPALVARFAESRQLPFGVVIDNTGAIARLFGDVSATPTCCLLDRRGAIAARHVGTPDPTWLRSRVEQLLAQA